MEWEVILDEGFHRWYATLEVGLQDEILANVELLRKRGPNLNRPRVDTVKGSLYSNMKELRIQYRGDPWRILFAFDPRRRAILLVGGNKRGKKDWYEQHIRIADQRYREHLLRLEEDEES
jgi:hypothetical protein